MALPQAIRSQSQWRTSASPHRVPLGGVVPILDALALSAALASLGQIRAVQFSSDGARLVAGGEQGVAIYDANTRELLRLIEHPALMTHASVPPEIRAQLGISDTLVRLSVGIEAADDLIADLAGALA